VHDFMPEARALTFVHTACAPRGAHHFIIKGYVAGISRMCFDRVIERCLGMSRCLFGIIRLSSDGNNVKCSCDLFSHIRSSSKFANFFAFYALCSRCVWQYWFMMSR
jgi:hypothetical protein